MILKTPLTIVRGNAELLSETELTTEQKNNITYVLNGTTQIQSYVKQLIDVTKSWNCSDVTYTTVRLEDFFRRYKGTGTRTGRNLSPENRLEGGTK